MPKLFTFTFFVVLTFFSSCKYLDRNANFISEEEVWRKIKTEGPKHGLNPSFIYAICHAESSLNANAESSVARGMMQLTEAAWQDVTQLHYRQAFEWETNVEVGILYLARLKGMLESVDLFSYPPSCDQLSLWVRCITEGKIYGE